MTKIPTLSAHFFSESRPSSDVDGDRVRVLFHYNGGHDVHRMGADEAFVFAQAILECVSRLQPDEPVIVRRVESRRSLETSREEFFCVGYAIDHVVRRQALASLHGTDLEAMLALLRRLTLGVGSRQDAEQCAEFLELDPINKQLADCVRQRLARE